MKEAKVSIICPVFNAEKTLQRCVNSILSQTFREWELLLIDDGSRDGSGAICDSYAQNDERIKVIHKTNGGVSSARQVGLGACNGDYIIHADPDDWMETTMLGDLYAMATESGADMVMCDFYCDYGEKSFYTKQKPSSLDAQTVLHEMFQHLHGNCWNKLIKRSVVSAYSIKFPEGVNYAEDVCFNVQLLINDINVVYLPKAFYHYVQHPTSITNSFSLETLFTCKKYIEFLEKEIPEYIEEIRQAKITIKKNVVNANLLSNKEIKQLYPDVRETTDVKLYERFGYKLAFCGYQQCGRIIFDIVKTLVKVRRGIYKRL